VPPHQRGEGVLVAGGGEPLEQLLVGGINGRATTRGGQEPDDGP
jgi:hypothetical protein